MSIAVKQILGRFGSLVSHVLINESDQFVAFGTADHDDLVIRGSMETRSKTFGLFTAHGPTNDSLERCQMLFGMVRDLTDQGFLGTFNLTALQVTNIKQCIQKLDATHIRFHSEKNGVHVSIFDVRRFDYENRIVRGKEVRLVVDTLSKQDAYSFSATIISATFLKLINDSYSVSIGKNYITRLTGNNSGLDYLIRDQANTEPVSFSSNELLGSEIALWLHSNSSGQVIHTTQQQDLE